MNKQAIEKMVQVMAKAHQSYCDGKACERYPDCRKITRPFQSWGYVEV